MMNLHSKVFHDNKLHVANNTDKSLEGKLKAVL